MLPQRRTEDEAFQGAVTVETTDAPTDKNRGGRKEPASGKQSKGCMREKTVIQVAVDAQKHFPHQDKVI